ncbi:MAG: serine/threonine protein kinase [Planctomycetes bacterium]|nr:serine/threonine protein kinase [Planctomycetota bacterium]
MSAAEPVAPTVAGNSSEAVTQRLLNAWSATLAACALDPNASADGAASLRPPRGEALTELTPRAESPTWQAPVPDPAEEAGRPAGIALDPELDLSRDIELLERLGAGGMGVVYRARQKGLDRDVAVKTLGKDAAAQGASAAEFLAEARIAAALDHPHIVPIHAIGRGLEGRPYLVMKRIEGSSWASLLGSDPPSAAPASLRKHLEILQKVVDAVAFAHDRGVIHRDLKPANVMLGSYGQVYVVDWGLALRMSGPAENAAGPGVGRAAPSPGGTPAYVSPEMAAGDEPLGPTADVYLLGAILHELLLGRPPHAGSSVVAMLLAALRNDVFPIRPPGGAAPELCRIAERCLATRPEDRFPSAVELREALARFLSGESRREEASALRDRARRVLETSGADAGGAGPRSAARYGALFEAQALIQRALEAWPEDADARALRDRIERMLLECALSAGDLSLAESLLRRARVMGMAGTEAIEAELERRRREADPAEILALDHALRRVELVSGVGLAAGASSVLLGAVVLPYLFQTPYDASRAQTTALLACVVGTALQVPFLALRRGLRARRPWAWRLAVALSFSMIVYAAAAFPICLIAEDIPELRWWPYLLLLPLVLYASVARGLFAAHVRRAFAGREGC